VTATPDVKHTLTALRVRHGLDRETVAAMTFERSRQYNVSLTQAFTELRAELLDQTDGGARADDSSAG
jgi:hypothetical protein